MMKKRKHSDVRSTGEAGAGQGSFSEEVALKRRQGTSLVAQWLRIRLPMLGTRVRALVREDPTCHRATKPVRHNY